MMLAYILAAALAVWLGLGVLAIFACAAGGRAEAAWRQARLRAERQAEQARRHQRDGRSLESLGRNGPIDLLPQPREDEQRPAPEHPSHLAGEGGPHLLAREQRLQVGEGDGIEGPAPGQLRQTG